MFNKKMVIFLYLLNREIFVLITLHTVFEEELTYSNRVQLIFFNIMHVSLGTFSSVNLKLGKFLNMKYNWKLG